MYLNLRPISVSILIIVGFPPEKMRTAFIKTGCQLREEMKLIFVIGMFFISSSL